MDASADELNASFGRIIDQTEESLKGKLSLLKEYSIEDEQKDMVDGDAFASSASYQDVTKISCISLAGSVIQNEVADRQSPDNLSNSERSVKECKDNSSNLAGIENKSDSVKAVKQPDLLQVGDIDKQNKNTISVLKGHGFLIEDNDKNNMEMCSSSSENRDSTPASDIGNVVCAIQQDATDEQPNNGCPEIISEDKLIPVHPTASNSENKSGCPKIGNKLETLNVKSPPKVHHTANISVGDTTYHDVKASKRLNHGKNRMEGASGEYIQGGEPSMDDSETLLSGQNAYSLDEVKRLDGMVKQKQIASHHAAVNEIDFDRQNENVCSSAAGYESTPCTESSSNQEHLSSKCVEDIDSENNKNISAVIFVNKAGTQNTQHAVDNCIDDTGIVDKTVSRKKEVNKQDVCQLTSNSGLSELSACKLVDTHILKELTPNTIDPSVSQIDDTHVDTMPCLSIVSVRGGVNQDELIDCDILDTEINKTDMELKKKLSAIACNVGVSTTCISDCENQSNEHSSVSVSNGCNDPTEESESLMIVDVRSLSQSDNIESDTYTIARTLTPTDCKTKTKEKQDRSYTSEAINALHDMCSAVRGEARNSPILPTTKAPTITKGHTGDVGTNQIILTNFQSSQSAEQVLPVISNVFSIKAEPRDYGDYSIAEGKQAVKQNSFVSDTNKRKHEVPTQACSVSKKRKDSNSIVQIGLPFSSQSATKVATGNVPVSIKNAVSNTPAVIKVFPGETKVKALSLPTTQMESTNALSANNMYNKTPLLVKTVCPQKHIIKPRTANQTPKTVVTLTPSDSVRFQSINIKSVGVGRITELIARKNPIATYKPPPIPEELESIVNTKQQYPCYECGDSFLFNKSLLNHMSRHSMKIHYKCEVCNATKSFTNKCQMLGHLRGHLNISKTQAVPIHIKSDSINISTYYDEIQKNKFKFFDTLPLCNTEENVQDPTATTAHCYFCNHRYTLGIADRTKHYKADSLLVSKMYCDICPIYLSNVCSMKAHKAIHEVNSANPPKILVCPECGDSYPLKMLDNFITHIKLKCAHLSRYCHFTCKKCSYECSNIDTFRNHLLGNLDIYYKCERCPMALRTMKTLSTHFNAKHNAWDSATKPEAKIIYRCHYCDTLIDQRIFLEKHIQSHIMKVKASADNHFYCFQCGQVFEKRAHFTNHFNMKHKVSNKQFTTCTFCRRDIGDYHSYAIHMLMNHTTSASKTNVKFCEDCGLVCIGYKMLHSHNCLKKIKVLGDAEVVNVDNDSDSDQLSVISSTIGSPNQSKHRKILPKIVDTTAEVYDVPHNSNPASEQPTLAEPSALDIPTGVSPVCVACGERFKNRVHRISHLKRHRTQNVFVCILCDDDRFNTYHEVRSHEIICSAVVQQAEREDAAVKSKRQTARKKTSPTKIKITKVDNEFSVKLIPKPGYSGETIPDIKHSCDQCEMDFSRKSKLEEHKKLDHGLHPCHLCGLMHDSNSSLKKHLILSHEGKKERYSCFVCKGRNVDRYFTEKYKLEKHLRQKHRLKQWVDSNIVPELPGLEGKGFSPEREKRKREPDVLDDVPKKKHKEKKSVYNCAKCLFTSDVREEFQTHIKEHDDSLTVQCFECGLCFAVLPSLRKHLFMVHKIRDFEAYCKTNDIAEPKETEIQNFFKADQDVTQPILEVTVDEEDEDDEDETAVTNRLECKVCHKQFDNEAGLKSHMRIHGMALIKKLRRKSRNPPDSVSEEPLTTRGIADVSQDGNETQAIDPETNIESSKCIGGDDKEATDENPCPL